MNVPLTRTNKGHEVAARVGGNQLLPRNWDLDGVGTFCKLLHAHPPCHPTAVEDLQTGFTGENTEEFLLAPTAQYTILYHINIAPA